MRTTAPSLATSSAQFPCNATCSRGHTVQCSLGEQIDALADEVFVEPTHCPFAGCSGMITTIRATPELDVAVPPTQHSVLDGTIHAIQQTIIGSVADEGFKNFEPAQRPHEESPLSLLRESKLQLLREGRGTWWLVNAVAGQGPVLELAFSNFLEIFPGPSEAMRLSPYNAIVTFSSVDAYLQTLTHFYDLFFPFETDVVLGENHALKIVLRTVDKGRFCTAVRLLTQEVLFDQGALDALHNLTDHMGWGDRL